MISCPIDYFESNLIFNQDKSCWAMFKLVGYDYDFMSTEGKISMLYKVARMLSGIMSEAQILVIPVTQNMKHRFQDMKANLNKDDVLYDTAQGLIDKTYEYLKSAVQDNGSVNDYNTYIVVKLQESTEFEMLLRAKELYEFFIKAPRNAIEVLLGTDAKDILQQKIDKYRRLAEKWFFQQNQKIRMVKADVEEVQWLIRRMPLRGLGKSVKLYTNKNSAWSPKAQERNLGKEKIISPDKLDIVRLFGGKIKSKNRVVTVDTNVGKSYQTFFVITKMPDEFDYPDNEWLYVLQQSNLQAEICINIKVTEHRESVRKLEIKRREINSQIEHVAGSDSDIPDELFEGKEYLNTMEEEVKSSKAPILNTSIAICLAANSLKALEEKADSVYNLYDCMMFEIERPVCDQLNLYYQFIPSVSTIVKDFVMPLTPVTLASGGIGATHQLGDNIGPYVGTTGIEEKQVFLQMGRACLLNRSASAVFLGNLGVGKSFNANLLMYLNIIFGGYGLIFDPKGERTHWKDELRVLNGLITIVTLSNSENDKGKLDPYNVYKGKGEIDMANELATNILTELFDIKPNSKAYIAVLEAVKNIEEGPGNPSMAKLADKLNSFDKKDDLYQEAKMLAREIRLQQKAGMAKLLFGDGTESAISIDNRLNILQIQNLKLPGHETEKDKYTTEEKLSTVIMMVLSHFAKKFALVKRPVFKQVLFDEAWMLGRTEEGVKLYDFLSRMGRSLYTGCIFNIHSVLDIPTEGIRNTITYKFCFRSDNDKEIDRMIELLGLENSQELHNRFKSLGSGECIFQDLDGHVGVLKFDAVFQDIIDVFSTTPKTTVEEEKIEINLEEDTSGITEIDIYEREVV